MRNLEAAGRVLLLYLMGLELGTFHLVTLQLRLDKLLNGIDSRFSCLLGRGVGGNTPGKVHQFGCSSLYAGEESS